MARLGCRRSNGPVCVEGLLRRLSSALRIRTPSRPDNPQRPARRRDVLDDVHAQMSPVNPGPRERHSGCMKGRLKAQCFCRFRVDRSKHCLLSIHCQPGGHVIADGNCFATKLRGPWWSRRESNPPTITVELRPARAYACRRGNVCEGCAFPYGIARVRRANGSLMNHPRHSARAETLERRACKSRPGVHLHRITQTDPARRRPVCTGSFQAVNSKLYISSSFG